MTACNQCLNRIIKPDNNGDNIWYNNTCKAKKREKQFEPITGKMEYLHGEIYVLCRELNDVDCEYFERRE